MINMHVAIFRLKFSEYFVLYTIYVEFEEC